MEALCIVFRVLYYMRVVACEFLKDICGALYSWKIQVVLSAFRRASENYERPETERFPESFFMSLDKMYDLMLTKAFPGSKTCQVSCLKAQ